MQQKTRDLDFELYSVSIVEIFGLSYRNHGCVWDTGIEFNVLNETVYSYNANIVGFRMMKLYTASKPG